MVTDRERRFCYWLARIGVFRVRIGFMRITEIVPRRGSRWILNWLKRRQIVDSLHHAPCCEANHYHKQRLVFLPCTCGAAAAAAAALPVSDT